MFVGKFVWLRFKFSWAITCGRSSLELEYVPNGYRHVAIPPITTSQRSSLLRMHVFPSVYTKMEKLKKGSLEGGSVCRTNPDRVKLRPSSYRSEIIEMKIRGYENEIRISTTDERRIRTPRKYSETFSIHGSELRINMEINNRACLWNTKKATSPYPPVAVEVCESLFSE